MPDWDRTLNCINEWGLDDLGTKVSDALELAKQKGVEGTAELVKKLVEVVLKYWPSSDEQDVPRESRNIFEDVEWVRADDDLTVYTEHHAYDVLGDEIYSEETPDARRARLAQFSRQKLRIEFTKKVTEVLAMAA